MIVVRGCAFPEDRYYDPQRNLWLRSEVPDVVVIGATSFAVAQAVEFFGFYPKPVGTAVDVNRAVGMIELAKTVVSVRTPVPGVIIEVNETARGDPALINTDPYEGGWLVKLQTAGWDADECGLVSGLQIAPAFEAAMILDNFEGAER